MQLLRQYPLVLSVSVLTRRVLVKLLVHYRILSWPGQVPLVGCHPTSCTRCPVPAHTLPWRTCRHWLAVDVPRLARCSVYARGLVLTLFSASPSLQRPFYEICGHPSGLSCSAKHTYSMSGEQVTLRVVRRLLHLSFFGV